jgi:hypothetical protein
MDLLLDTVPSHPEVPDNTSPAFALTTQEAFELGLQFALHVLPTANGDAHSVAQAVRALGRLNRTTRMMTDMAARAIDPAVQTREEALSAARACLKALMVTRSDHALTDLRLELALLQGQIERLERLTPITFSTGSQPNPSGA